MSFKHTLFTGAALMTRGPQVTFSPDGEGGGAPAADPLAAEAPEGAAVPEATREDDAPAGEAPEGGEKPSEGEKKSKSPVAQLQGRVGHLTRTLHDKDQAIADKDRRIEALEAIVAAAGKGGGDEEKPTANAPITTPTPGTAEFQTLVRTEAEKVAAEEAFTRDCNAIADDGEKKYGDTFKEGVANLNALGLMDANLVQAAMATGAAADVLNALGQDVDEAARIGKLPPARMGVELANLANKLRAPKESKQISRAPAPIEPVGGSVKPAVDLESAAKSDDMNAYVAARKAQGSRWAR